MTVLIREALDKEVVDISAGVAAGLIHAQEAAASIIERIATKLGTRYGDV